MFTQNHIIYAKPKVLRKITCFTHKIGRFYFFNAPLGQSRRLRAILACAGLRGIPVSRSHQLHHRHKGTFEIFRGPVDICLRLDSEQQQNFAVPYVVGGQLKAAFFDARGPDEHKILPVGAVIEHVLERPALHTLATLVKLVADRNGSKDAEVPRALHGITNFQSVQKGSHLTRFMSSTTPNITPNEIFTHF